MKKKHLEPKVNFGKSVHIGKKWRAVFVSFCDAVVS